MKTNCCILWSVRDNHWKVEQKVDLHQRKIREATYSLWGVDFLVKKHRFTYPLKGFVYVAGTGQVRYETRVIDIVQEHDLNHIPVPFYGFKFRTYLALDRLEELSRSIPWNTFRRCSDGGIIGHPPQNYIYVEPPDFDEDTADEKRKEKFREFVKTSKIRG